MSDKLTVYIVFIIWVLIVVGSSTAGIRLIESGGLR